MNAAVELPLAIITGCAVGLSITALAILHTLDKIRRQLDEIGFIALVMSLATVSFVIGAIIGLSLPARVADTSMNVHMCVQENGAVTCYDREGRIVDVPDDWQALDPYAIEQSPCEKKARDMEPGEVVICGNKVTTFTPGLPLPDPDDVTEAIIENNHQIIFRADP